MTDLDLRTVSVLERLRLAQARGINPRPRKYPLKYPHRVRSKSLVISRTCEKYPQYPQYPRDAGDILRGAYTHKETLNFTLLIYICMKKPNPRNPERRGDFGDIGDIFGKPSDHAGLRVLGSGDILGMSPGDGDVPEGRGCAPGIRHHPLPAHLTNETGCRYYRGLGPDSELRLSSESWQ